MAEKHNRVDLVIGRFNPLTIYHKELISAIGAKGMTIVATTKTQDANNPLAPNIKRLYMHHAHLNVRGIVICKDAVDAILSVKAYGADEVVIHCGDDRADNYLRLNTYTEPDGVKIVDVVSAKRLHSTHSATYLRALAKDGREQEFMDLCGYRGQCKQFAYRLIRQYYGCI